MRKTAISIISMLCFLTITPSVHAEMYIMGPAEQIFKDVPKQSQFFDSISYFSTEVPIIYQERAYFKPLDKVTKAEFFKLLIASTGYTPQANKDYDIPFHDIVGDEWFAPYIYEALNRGLINFSEENPNFSPGNIITRLEGVKLVLKAYDFNYNVTETSSTGYIDVPRTSKYAKIAQLAYEMQLLNDYKSRRFESETELNRAQVIRILYQIHLNKDFDISSVAKSAGDLTSEENFRIMLEVWEKINNEYINKGEIDKNELVYGAISGMVASLNDPYSVFFEPIEASDYKDSLDGSSFEGI